MEPVTHILTGACLARTGLNRRAAYATLVMAVAAEFPDIDTLWGFIGGPVTGFQHHRGITHTFLGIPFEAAFLVALAYSLHRWRVSRVIGRKQSTPEPGHSAVPQPLTAAPVRWGLLYLFALLALLSHLLLDYTNNYGLRPFFPFNPRWYAASITFIFDPAMFLLLLAAVVLPLLFRLIGSEISSRRQPFAARGWSIAALVLVAALWTLRATQHNRAVTIAQAQTFAVATAPASGPASPLDPPPVPAPLVNAQAALAGADPDLAPAPASPPSIYLQPQRVLANPDPLNPFRWFTVTDFGSLYELAEVDTRTGTYRPGQQPTPKPEPGPALRAAEGSALGRAYLDWSPMPFLSVDHAAPGSPSDDLSPGHTLVTFRDARFMGDIPFMRSRAPLQGTVELDINDHVVEQTMDGKPQR